jgi:hypothetical protein
MGGCDWEDLVWGLPGELVSRPHLQKITRPKWTGGVAQVVERQALSSNPSPTKLLSLPISKQSKNKQVKNQTTLMLPSYWVIIVILSSECVFYSTLSNIMIFTLLLPLKSSRSKSKCRHSAPTVKRDLRSAGLFVRSEVLFGSSWCWLFNFEMAPSKDM